MHATWHTLLSSAASDPRSGVFTHVRTFSSEWGTPAPPKLSTTMALNGKQVPQRSQSDRDNHSVIKGPDLSLSGEPARWQLNGPAPITCSTGLTDSDAGIRRGCKGLRFQEGVAVAENRKLSVDCMQDFIHKRQAAHTKNRGTRAPGKILRGP